MYLKAEMSFIAKGIESDSLYVFPFSGGKDSLGNPIIKISSIKVNAVNTSKKVKNSKIELYNVRNNDNITITYEFNLNDIFDWRKSFGYILFPSSSSDNSWYPDIYINGDRNYYKNFEVKLTYPKKLAILTSGYKTNTVRKKSQKTSAFKVEDIRYFALNAGWDFVVNSIKTNKTEIFYFCPKDLTDVFSNVAQTASNIIAWYESVYGFFPLKHVGIVIGHKKWQGGFPTENVFYIHQGNLDTSFLQWITSHELGHYYWGYHVKSDGLSPLMLSSGIWIDHLYLSEAYKLSLEDTWNSGAYRAGMMERYLETYLSNVEQQVGLPAEQYKKLNFDYNSNISHGKASVGMYLISREIGFKNFLNIQKDILKKYQGKQLSTQNFIDYCTQNGHPFVKHFMKQWNNDNAIIEYELKNIKKLNKNNGWEYSFSIVKRGSVDYPIEIEVEDKSGNVYLHKTQGNSKKEIVKGISNSEPLSFNLDPKGAVPMWNSSHPAIQLNYIRALKRAGHTQVANELAMSYLKKYPKSKRAKRIID